MGIEPFDYQKRTNIEEHNQIVDKLNEVVDAVNIIDPSVQGLEPRVTALETDVTDLGTRVDSVESKNVQQDTEISTIKGKVTVNTNNIEQVDNRVNEAFNTINEVQTGLDQNMNELGGRVNELGDAVATVTGQVTQLETDTTNLDGMVTDLDGRVTTLAGNYTTLGGRVDSLNTEVGQLSTGIGNLETGKVNVSQGTENAGKVLGIGADGNVTPVEQSGGSGETRVSGTFTSAEFAQKVINGEIGCGDCINTSLNITVDRLSSASLFTLDESTKLRCLNNIKTTFFTETTSFDFVIITSTSDASYVTLSVTPTTRRYVAGFALTIGSESISYGLHRDVILDSVRINKSTKTVELIYKILSGASFRPDKNIVNCYIVITNSSQTQTNNNNFNVNVDSLT